MLMVFAKQMKLKKIIEDAGFTGKTTPKQAFEELRPGLDGATLYCINNSKCFVENSTCGLFYRANSKLNNMI